MNNTERLKRLKEIILENNCFDTLAGQRFKEMYGLDDIQAAISFGGRSKKRESYRLTGDSDSDQMFVTHLYIDRYGDLYAQVCTDDDDSLSVLLKPSAILVDECMELEEWLNVLDY